MEALCGRLKRRRPTQPLRGRHRSPAADTDMPVSTHRPYFAKLALGSFSVFKWQPCASRPRGPTQKPRGRLRVPLSDTAPPRPTRYTWRRPPRHLAPADTAPAAGRHGTCRRPTQHLAPADSHTQRRPTRPPRRPTHRGRHRPCPKFSSTSSLSSNKISSASSLRESSIWLRKLDGSFFYICFTGCFFPAKQILIN